MPATAKLIRRSGPLKRELIAYAQSPRFTAALREARGKQPKTSSASKDAQFADLMDRFMFLQRLPDGRTVVDHFVEEHPELFPAERAMLLGWQNMVEGIWVIQRREGDALVMTNLLDEMEYRVYANVGPGVFASMPPGSFFIGRLVPLGKDWLISGYPGVLPADDVDQVYRIALDFANKHPSLVFRNPEKVRQGWELQHKERGSFIAFFGSDLVVLPGHELAERMRAYMRFLVYEARDAAGRTRAEKTMQTYGVEPPVAEFDLPKDLTTAETVGVIFDEVDGLNFLPDFGLIEEVFSDPERADDPRYAEIVLGYLESQTISPRVLQRLAERDPVRASRVFQRVLAEPDFAWERDGEALLHRYKASYFERPVLPGTTPVSSTLARATLTTPPAPKRPSRRKRDQPR